MEKWYPIDPYIWVALSQTWCFQNESSKSSQIQIHYMSQCQNFIELTLTT
jgi:hypothetical protein